LHPLAKLLPQYDDCSNTKIKLMPRFSNGRAALLRGHHARRRSSTALPLFAPILSWNWYKPLNSKA
jgi:hypothetical protein